MTMEGEKDEAEELRLGPVARTQTLLILNLAVKG